MMLRCPVTLTGHLNTPTQQRSGVLFKTRLETRSPAAKNTPMPGGDAWHLIRPTRVRT